MFEGKLSLVETDKEFRRVACEDRPHPMNEEVSKAVTFLVLPEKGTSFYCSACRTTPLVSVRTLGDGILGFRTRNSTYILEGIRNLEGGLH